MFIVSFFVSGKQYNGYVDLPIYKTPCSRRIVFDKFLPIRTVCHRIPEGKLLFSAAFRTVQLRCYDYNNMLSSEKPSFSVGFAVKPSRLKAARVIKLFPRANHI